MILDEYGDEDRSRFFSSIALAGMALTHDLTYCEFQSFCASSRFHVVSTFLSAFTNSATCRRRERLPNNPRALSVPSGANPAHVNQPHPGASREA
jgi:hypothetical protein